MVDRLTGSHGADSIRTTRAGTRDGNVQVPAELKAVVEHDHARISSPVGRTDPHAELRSYPAPGADLTATPHGPAGAPHAPDKIDQLAHDAHNPHGAMHAIEALEVGGQYGARILGRITRGAAVVAEVTHEGAHGHHGLVPWIWTSIGMSLVALGLLLGHRRHGRRSWLNAACGFVFAAVWIEKGMGLIVPGFIPSTLHELIEYSPSLTEWKITAGVWAFGLMILTIGVRLAAPVLLGHVAAERGENRT